MILVTGGTGVMGSVLVRKLHEAGHAIRVFTLPDDRHVSRIEAYAEDIKYGDISKESDVAGICRDCDKVYHCAAVIVTSNESLFKTINVAGTHNLIEDAKRAKVNHFIYISSASVTYQKPTPYSLSKRACEEIVTTSGLPFTIIRPTLVYDKGKGGLEFDLFLDYLKKFPAVPFIGAGNALKRPVFVDDIIEGLVSIANNEQSLGKIYNFSGGETIRLKDFSRLCLALSGMPKKPIISLPVWPCGMVAAVMRIVMKNPPLNWQKIAGVIQDADLDPREAIEDLGYNPKKVKEQLEKCFPRI